MVDTISNNIVLYDDIGRVVTNLKSGAITQVRVYNTTIYKIQDKDFSNINNKKNNQGD